MLSFTLKKKDHRMFPLHNAYKLLNRSLRLVYITGRRPCNHPFAQRKYLVKRRAQEQPTLLFKQAQEAVATLDSFVTPYMLEQLIYSDVVDFPYRQRARCGRIPSVLSFFIHVCKSRLMLGNIVLRFSKKKKKKISTCLLIRQIMLSSKFLNFHFGIQGSRSALSLGLKPPRSA